MKASDILQAMLDAGAPIEAAMIALRALEAKDAEIAARDAEVLDKRAKDAERKRQSRASGDSPRTIQGRGADVVETTPLSRPPNENISNPPTHTPPDITTRARGGDFPMLDCADPALWADFLRNRKAKRLPNTGSAHRKLQTDLAEVSARTGWPPGKVFAACVAKGWGAIYETDEMKGATNGRPSKAIRGSCANGAGRSSLAKAIDEGLEFLGSSAQA